MGFTYDSTGVNTEQKSFELIPDGKYTLKIIEAEEKESAKGNLMGKLKCEVMNNVDYNGRLVFHNVTFLPPTTNGKPTPGAGMAIHFLKCIQKKWDGKIDIEIKEWEGAQFIAKVGHTTYINKDGKVVGKNEINAVEIDPNYIPF